MVIFMAIYILMVAFIEKSKFRFFDAIVRAALAVIGLFFALKTGVKVIGAVGALEILFISTIHAPVDIFSIFLIIAGGIEQYSLGNLQGVVGPTLEVGVLLSIVHLSLAMLAPKKVTSDKAPLYPTSKKGVVVLRAVCGLFIATSVGSLVLLSLAPTVSKTPSYQGGEREYEVYYETKFLEYGNVGNDWGLYLKDKTDIIRSGERISKKGAFDLIVTAIEYDDASDDVGTEIITISPYQDFPLTKTVVVTVRERNGRGAGSAAEIQFTIRIELIE